MTSSIRITLLTTALLIQASMLSATSFNISNASTAAQTLATGQTGVITSTGSLTLGSSTVPILVTGSSTVTNSGQIIQTGTGRGITNETGTVTLGITNNTSALIQTASGDALRISQVASNVTLDNYGTITSLNASKGGSQAVDWNSITTGSNVLTNYSTGLIQSSDADSVRPGVNGFIYNYGTIKATVTTDTGSDAIDLQKNTGVTITNYSTGLIDSPRHGITGGVTNSASFTTNITNNSGGIIRGNDGSGINLDGINANQTATVVNNGTITGNGVTGDGDGIDSDGLITLTNTGIIRSINAVSSTTPAHSEGITVGGGTIINSGTIEGLVASGNTNAIGIGISLLGNDSLTNPGTREAIYGNATVTNQAGGLIRGDSASGILVDGPASGFTVTINNQSGGTIRGGGSTTAAILTGADNDTINNAGTIDGSSNGKAIDMGAGNNTLKITGGSASVLGDINGGTGGTNAATIDPGTGNSFSYAGHLSNFNSVDIKSGSVSLTSTALITSNATVKVGASLIDSGIFDGTSTTLAVETGGKFYVTAAGSTGLAAFTGTGQTLNLGSGAQAFFDIGGTTRGTGYDYITGLANFTLPVSGEAAHFMLNLLGSYTPTAGDTFDLVDWSNATSSSSVFDFTAAPNGFVWDTSNFLTNGTISLSAAPEPSRALLLMIGIVGGFMRRRRSV